MRLPIGRRVWTAGRMLERPSGGGTAGVVRWFARTRQAIHPFTRSLPSPDPASPCPFSLSLSLSPFPFPRRLASPLVVLSLSRLPALPLPLLFFTCFFHDSSSSFRPTKPVSLAPCPTSSESIGEVHRAVCLPSCLLGRAQAQA